jgi:catechol 2,3-dioxygenase-like lactoylglutathione lyase family enzyme
VAVHIAAATDRGRMRGPKRRYIPGVFDHVAVRATDRPQSERFYRAVLGTLGIEPGHAGETLIEWGDFSLAGAGPERPPTRHAHIGFVAPSRERVDAFWQAGVDAGYSDDGAPSERPQYKPGYYGAFLLDPDGNSIEAVHHSDTRRGGNIDHLWIRVSDLDAAAAFYSTIARYAGLREGGRWEGGRQFQGAWSTFSLIDDPRPLTDNLHVAFPAPDHETVQEFHRAAIAAGYQSNGGPGERPQYHPGYYASFVLDPDGNNIESVFHGE